MSRASLPGIPGTASSSSRERRDEALGRAEVLEQRPLSRRADAAQLVEQRAGHRLAAPAAVVVEREPVRLVADPLQQPQALGVGRDRERLGAARARRPPRAASPARSPRVPRSTSGPSDLIPAESWPLPPSITIRSGHRGEALVALGVVRGAVGLLEQLRDPPPEHLLHRAKSSGPDAQRSPADPEPAVVGLLRRAALEDDHRGDRVLAADVGDVEALDPDRERVEPERVLERRERVDALGAAALLAQPVLGERERRVALGELAQAALRAALGDPDLDRPAAPRRERLGERPPRARASPGRRRPAAGSPAPPSSTGRGTPRSPRPRPRSASFAR